LLFVRVMNTAPDQDMIVSKNRVEGSIAEVPIPHLLDTCLKHLVTGAIKVTAPDGKRGVLVLRAGAVDQARFGDAVGDAAVEQLGKLGDGSYELAQRLPDLSGHLGGAASLEGAVADVALIPIMRHCEQNALTCTITVVTGFDRAEILYRAGELAEITMNGKRDDDSIVQILTWKDARFRCSAPPLPLDIRGWPKIGREATQPFKLEKAFAPPPAKATRADADAAAAKRRHDQRMAVGTGEAKALVATAPILPTQPGKAAPAARERVVLSFGSVVVNSFLLTTTVGLIFLLTILRATR
jgi:hypothetical protein